MWTPGRRGDVLRRCIERACVHDGFVQEVFAGRSERRVVYEDEARVLHPGARV